MIRSIEAHRGAIWAVTPLPDNSGLITGSADHEAKFWEWEVQALSRYFCLLEILQLWKVICDHCSSHHLATGNHRKCNCKCCPCVTNSQVREEAQGEGTLPKRVLSLRHTRTCKMSDDVLAVKITPDGRLLALALLDSTVQVCFHLAIQAFFDIQAFPSQPIFCPAICLCLKANQATLLLAASGIMNTIHQIPRMEMLQAPQCATLLYRLRLLPMDPLYLRSPSRCRFSLWIV